MSCLIQALSHLITFVFELIKWLFWDGSRTDIIFLLSACSIGLRLSQFRSSLSRLTLWFDRLIEFLDRLMELTNFCYFLCSSSSETESTIFLYELAKFLSWLVKNFIGSTQKNLLNFYLSIFILSLRLDQLSQCLSWLSPYLGRLI